MLYCMAGRRREMGLGNTISVPLAKAREAAAEARALIQQRIDPIEARNSTVAPAKAAPTFGEVAEAYMADREAAWRNALHRRQWRQTLEV